MKCSHCSMEIVLVPSAEERAKKSVGGQTADFFRRLFTIHANCQLKLRAEETQALLARQQRGSHDR